MICVTFNLNDPEGTRKLEWVKQGGNPDELVDG